MYVSIGRHLVPGLQVWREAEGGHIALRDPDLNLYVQLSPDEARTLRDELTRLLEAPAEAGTANAQPQATAS